MFNVYCYEHILTLCTIVSISYSYNYKYTRTLKNNAYTGKSNMIQYLRRYMSAHDFILKVMYKNVPEYDLITVYSCLQ